MDKKTLKKLMTDLAKGKITQIEVDNYLKSKKVENQRVETQKNTHTKKRTTKSLGGKK